jgi:hypothetical protein
LSGFGVNALWIASFGQQLLCPCQARVILAIGITKMRIVTKQAWWEERLGTLAQSLMQQVDQSLRVDSQRDRLPQFTVGFREATECRVIHIESEVVNVQPDLTMQADPPLHHGWRGFPGPAHHLLKVLLRDTGKILIALQKQVPVRDALPHDIDLNFLD